MLYFHYYSVQNILSFQLGFPIWLNELYWNVLLWNLKFPILGDFLAIFLLSLYSLLPIWLENILCYVFNPLIFLKNFFIAQHTLYFVQCSMTTWKVCVFFLMSVMSGWLCQVGYGSLVVQILYISINFFCLSYLKLWLWICLFLLPFPANFWLIQLKTMLLSAHNFRIIFSFFIAKYAFCPKV